MDQAEYTALSLIHSCDRIFGEEQCAAFLRRLDHDRRHGESGGDAVAQPEAEARHGHIRRKLAHDRAAARDALRARARKIQIDRRARCV